MPTKTATKGTTKRKPVRRHNGNGRSEVVPKLPLAKEVARLIEQKELSQTAAAAVTGEAQSQLSLLIRGQMKGFSPDRMFRLLTRLGRDVDITVHRSENPIRGGKVRLMIKK